MKIAIASDHAGFELKEAIIKHLEKKEVNFKDFGTYNRESVDYPDFAIPAAEAVARGEFTYGIIICGSGQGMTMVSNKIKGIRAALCNDLYSSRMSRLHNDANVLTMGGRIIGEDLALEIVDTWLSTEFEGGRHQRRVDKIMSAEKKH
jgi:ribose 5-phosphate isomerase B